MKQTQKDKAVNEAKKIAKLRDGYVCRKCTRSRAQGWQIHGAHIVPVGYGATAANPENIIALCAMCHSMGKTSAHDHPHEFVRWYDEKYPGEYDRLWKIAREYDANPFPKIDWIEKREELRVILKAMEGAC